MMFLVSLSALSMAAFAGWLVIAARGAAAEVHAIGRETGVSRLLAVSGDRE